MNTTITVNTNQVTLLRKAALIAGFAVLIMALTVPIVEFYIFPKLINYKNAVETTNNISNNRTLFSTAIFIHLTTVVCDIVSAWALYIFLKPIDKNLSLLAAWFRIVNTAFTISALLNLVQILSLLKASENFNSIPSSQVHDYVLFYLRAFNLQWRFMLAFFGIYMNLLGYLVLRSRYIPKAIGVCLVIAGLGYLIDNLKHFFYPNLDTGFLWFTYFGELIFMFWLLIKGSRMKELITG